MNKEVNILFLGQLREKENFINEIEKIKSLRTKDKINQIVFVTDIGEVNSKDRVEIELAGVKIIEKERLSDDRLLNFDPNLKSRSTGIRKRSGGMRGGTIWRQLFDLQYGLNLFDDESYVLRSRTDLSIPSSFYEKIFSQPNIYLRRNENKQSPFRKKIWVQWYHILKPFYIHDTAFMGLNHDLKKLVSPNLNIELAQYYPTSSLPVFFWIFPYSNIPEIKVWLNKYSSKDVSFKLLFNKEYLQALEIYYNIINRDFEVEFPKIQWILQWEPGVYKTRIWKKYEVSKGFISNALRNNYMSETNFFSKKVLKSRNKLKTIHFFNM